MKSAGVLSIGIAVVLAWPGSSPAVMNLPYFEDFESVAPGTYWPDQTDVWGRMNGDLSPVVTDAQAASGTQSVADAGADTGMRTAPFDTGPLTGDKAGISFMWYKEQWLGGEWDRVRIDAWADAGQRACTLVIWGGFVLNDQFPWNNHDHIPGIQLNTWYEVELLFNRKADDSGYEEFATVNVYNADGSLFDTMAFQTGRDNRAVPDEIVMFDVSWYPNAGIHIDDISIFNSKEIDPPPECSPGDADGDGDVDDDDLSLLLANWGQDVTGDPDGGCGKGEFSETAPVDDDDLSLLLANWTGPLAAAVPEPVTILLLAFAAPALWRSRR